MNDDRDPPRLRLSGDSPSDLVQALELARHDLPRATDLMRLQAGIDAALAASSEDAPTSELQVKRRRRSMRPVAAGATTSFKLMLAAAVAASGLGAGLWVFATTPTAEEPHAVAAPSPTAARPSSQIVPFEVREAPAESAPGAAPNEPKASALVVPEAKPRAVPTNETTVRGASNAGPPVGAAAFGDPGATEVSLLGRAQQALATDPGGALALTVEHARAFPRGTLAQEREFIAIQALEALGRHTEAVARAAQFRANYPSSAHLRRLDPLLGIPANAAP